jgi:hypothetical protein
MKTQKYPRTPHLPWSPGATSDDKVLKSLEPLLGMHVVASEKLDGENSTLTRSGFHARSVDSRHHVSRDWLARFHAEFAHEIPEGWRICGENLYAKHTLHYQALPTYFMGFSMWDERNWCLSWADTVGYFKMLGIEPVPVLWEGELTVAALKKIEAGLDLNVQEGFVVRPAGAFAFEDFGKLVAKFVRKGHVATDKHWAHQQVVPNILAAGKA